MGREEMERAICREGRSDSQRGKEQRKECSFSAGESFSLGETFLPQEYYIVHLRKPFLPCE
jgi:hypothetical protein